MLGTPASGIPRVQTGTYRKLFLDGKYLLDYWRARTQKNHKHFVRDTNEIILVGWGQGMHYVPLPNRQEYFICTRSVGSWGSSRARDTQDETRTSSMKDSAQEKVPVTQTLSFCQMHFLSPLPVAFDRKLVSVFPLVSSSRARTPKRTNHETWTPKISCIKCWF